MSIPTAAVTSSPRGPRSSTVRGGEAGAASLSRRPAEDPVRGSGRSAPVALGLAVVVGLVWGAATSGLQTLLPTSGLANAVSPWVAPAFLVGALSRRPRVALLAGVVVCSGEVGGYYATSALRGFGINPAMVALWAGAGVVGGPVFGTAGWCWRRVRQLRWAALGAALLAGVFLTEGAVHYGAVLHHTGNAVVFCAIGVLLLVVLGATARAARTAGAPGRGAGAAAAWLVVVLVLGAAGQMSMVSLMGFLFGPVGR